MIPVLDGSKETVNFEELPGVVLHHNKLVEDYPYHWHTAVEIIRPIKNSYKAIIADQTYNLKEDDIMIITPGTLHQLQAPPTGERNIMLFDCNHISSLSEVSTLLNAIVSSVVITKESNPELHGSLVRILDEIESEYSKRDPFTTSSIYSLIIKFLVTLGRASIFTENKFPETSTVKRREYIEKYINICNYISEHCVEDLSIDDIASKAGFSRFHFSRLFKDFTGMACYDYITQCRIAKAESMLILPDISITDVAMQSGFNSLSTFNRIFKSVKGCTPSEYKKMNRANHNLQKDS
ncbi:MAG: AraC family transcriptional regulator [Butyrivibrio sp.]|nr:AraC family transcriptional regulator [Butyrivibrio sp.]